MSEDIRDTEIELLDQLAQDATFKDALWISREQAHKFSQSDQEAEYIAYANPKRVRKLIERLLKAEAENEELREELESEAEVESAGPTHRTWPDVISEIFESFGGMIIFFVILAIIYMPEIVKAFHSFKC